MILSQQISPLFCLFFVCFLEKIDAVIHSTSKSFVKNYKHLDPGFTINKVSLTQIGYIQFLKYATKVPTLTDYTFCIWVNSVNLTHNQPLLSYSKHEEERLIRVWISPKGNDLKLEILQHPITVVPINMVGNRWYHICQSWESSRATWEIYIDGKLKSSGFVPKLKGAAIKGGGDIVVGQEYTDFDKGLDDGIEGDVFGFNFVLASTSGPVKHPINPIKLVNYPLSRYTDGEKRIKPQLRARKRPNIYPYPQLPFNFQPEPRERLIIGGNNWDFRDIRGGYSDRTLGRGIPAISRYSRGQESMNFRNNAFNKINYFDPRNNNVPFYNKRRITNDIGVYQKSLGLLLVELSSDCTFRKGAPLSGKGVLISWTQSVVRVYGGAILKNISPFCRDVGG